MENEREQLRQLLKGQSLMFGDFTLASGKKSTFYFDSKRTTLLSDGAWLTAREILRLIREKRIQADAIGGLTLGADPIVCPVAALSHTEGPKLRAFIVRKEAKGHGKGKRIEGDLRAGDDVVVVDDVVTTAGSTIAAIRAVEEIGCVVAAVLCVVDREEGGAEALKGYRFYPLFTATDLLAGRGGA